MAAGKWDSQGQAAKQGATHVQGHMVEQQNEQNWSYLTGGLI